MCIVYDDDGKSSVSLPISLLLAFSEQLPPFSFLSTILCLFSCVFTYVQRRQFLFKGGLNLVTAISGTLIFE